jgi:hypothetical protein
MPQRQVLGAGRGTDGVGLDEAQMIDRLLKRSRPKQAAGNCRTPQIVKGQRESF